MARTIIFAQPFVIVKTLNFNGKLFSKFLFFSLVFLLFFLLIVSVWQINGYGRDIFLLQKLSQELDLASKENKMLEINFNKSNSLENFADSIQSQPFEKAVKIDYIRVLDRKVVSKAR